jgi:hypothetical protein
MAVSRDSRPRTNTRQCQLSGIRPRSAGCPGPHLLALSHAKNAPRANVALTRARRERRSILLRELAWWRAAADCPTPLGKGRSARRGIADQPTRHGSQGEPARARTGPPNARATPDAPLNDALPRRAHVAVPSRGNRADRRRNDTRAGGNLRVSSLRIRRPAQSRHAQAARLTSTPRGRRYAGQGTSVLLSLLCGESCIRSRTGSINYLHRLNEMGRRALVVWAQE